MKSATLSCLVLEDGLFPTPIRIEAVVRPGLPVFRVTGTGRRSSRDREDRIKTALLASGIAFPYNTIIIHLSPAEISKESALLDLPIAFCLLLALGEAPSALSSLGPPWNETLFLGELSLTGEILDLPPAVAWALAAPAAGFRKAVVPRRTAAALPPSGLEVHHAASLHALLNGKHQQQHAPPMPAFAGPDLSLLPALPLRVTRALALAAAGRHPVLLVGPPGTGKSTAAELLHSLLPAPADEEWTQIVRQRLIFQEPETGGRPLRRPHHTITVAGLVGGGNPVRAGEASRATHGLLLLDELSEFDPAVIQALREPLEKGFVLHNRGGRPGTLPASFWFAATSNPCACGYFGSRVRACSCARGALDRSRSILAGPLRDRIDLELFVDVDPSRPEEDLLRADHSALVEMIRRSVFAQTKRYGMRRYNGELNGEETERHCEFETAAVRRLWADRTRDIGSKRQEGGIRRLARTIADMDESPRIRAKDVMEALTFRFQHLFWDPPLTPRRGTLCL